MQIDITKLDRQRQSSLKWRDARGIGALDLTPRFGKTFLAINFIINPHLRINNTNTVKIVVPSDIIVKHWIENLKSYGEHLGRITIISVNSVINDSESECTLLVVDEIQKFLTPGRKAVIDGTLIKHNYRLGLTGTYPYGIPWIEELYPVVDKITEEEAVANKWISPFVEYNILLELPQVDKARYERFSKPIYETLEMFKPVVSMLTREEGKRMFEDEFDLIQACHNGFSTKNLQGYDIYITYDKLCNAIAQLLGWHVDLNITIPENEELNRLWSPHSIHNRAKVFMDYVKKRNEILIDHPNKMHMIGEIINRNSVPTICFNESTKFADSVAEYINARFNPVYKAVCYHSKIESRPMIDPTSGKFFLFTSGDRKGTPKIFGKDSIKKIVIQGMREGFYQFISTAKALDEGVDIPVIEQVICTAGTTNPLTYQQRTARGKTIDIYNPNKITYIFNLVFDDFVNSDGELIKSRDKSKLILRQSQSSSDIHWIKSLDEINFTDNE